MQVVLKFEYQLFFYHSRLNASGTQIWVPTLFIVFITEGWMQVVLKVEYQLYFGYSHTIWVPAPALLLVHAFNHLRCYQLTNL